MCRLDPMPPKAVPESSPSSASATVPTSSTETTTNRSPGTWGSGAATTSGTSAPTTRLASRAARRCGHAAPQSCRSARSGSLRQQLAQVPPRLADPGPGPALEPGPGLAGHTDHHRCAATATTDLASATSTRQHLERSPGHHQQHQDQRAERVRQVAVDAAVLRPARRVADPVAPARTTGGRAAPRPRRSTCWRYSTRSARYADSATWVTSMSRLGCSASSNTRIRGSAYDVAVYCMRGLVRTPPQPQAGASTAPGRRRREHGDGTTTGSDDGHGQQREGERVEQGARARRAAAAGPHGADPVDAHGPREARPPGPGTSAEPDHGRGRGDHRRPHRDRRLAGGVGAGERGRARNAMPNALTKVSRASPAVSATTASASGIVTATTGRPASAPWIRACSSVHSATNPAVTGSAAAPRAPTPNAAPVHRHPRAQPAEPVEVALAGGRAARRRRRGTAWP